MTGRAPPTNAATTCSPVAGVEQGSSAASPLFGVGMALPLEPIAAPPSVNGRGAFQDDIIFQVPVDAEVSGGDIEAVPELDLTGRSRYTHDAVHCSHFTIQL